MSPVTTKTCARLPEAAHGLHFATPSPTCFEGLPLGNGLLGAMVWGDGQPLNISLDRTDLWDLRPDEHFQGDDYTFATLRQWREAGRFADIIERYESSYKDAPRTKIPAGRITLQCEEETFTTADLDLADGVASVQLGATQVQVFVHANQPIGVIAVRGKQPFTLKLIAPPFGPGMDYPAGEDDRFAKTPLTDLGYAPPTQESGYDFQCYVQECYGGFRFAIYVKYGVHNGLWQAVWSIATSNEGDDPLALARERACDAHLAGYGSVAGSHRDWWHDYWSQAAVSLPDKTIERQWYLDTYKFGAASRRGAPPISLQGPWTNDNGRIPPWKGDYHHDLNTQLSYWPCYSGNRLEAGLCYLDWLWQTKRICEAWTQQFFGMPGLNVPAIADLNNEQLGGWVQYSHSPTTAAWLAQHFYLHWRYSMDRDFLRERAYPYLRDASIFIEAYTAERDEDGKRTVPLSATPEVHDNKPAAWFDTVTNYDLALARWLLAATAELATELGDAGDAVRWQGVLGELPDFARDHSSKLLLAKDTPLHESHRHFSHLMAIHPLGIFRWEDGADAQRTMRAALDELDRLGPDYWCGYSYAWLASLAARARDGERAARALQIFAEAFVLRNSFHCNGDQTGKGYSKFDYRPFTLEGNFAAAAGVQEMLLQSYGGAIRVFPAVPASWRDVAFTNLRAEGGFVISAAREDGVTTRIEIEASVNGTCVVDSPFTGRHETVALRAGERVTLKAQE